jgi:transcriptional regulator GlxA family with amidase domain
MQELPVELAFIQHRRRADTKLNVELAVAFLRIELPDFVAIEIVAGKLAGADEDEDMLAVSTRRSRRGVALVAPCPSSFFLWC